MKASDSPTFTGCSVEFIFSTGKGTCEKRGEVVLPWLRLTLKLRMGSIFSCLNGKYKYGLMKNT